MNQLKERLKTNDIPKLMLFHGQENYLIDLYLKRTIEACLAGGDKTMNYDLFNDKKTTVETISDSLETMPFFSDHRVVVLKELGLFDKTGTKTAEALLPIVESIPETTYLIIIEGAIDKRTKFFKHCQKEGLVCEFPYLGESDLVSFIARALNQYQKRISNQVAHHLIHYVGGDMTFLQNEIEKLAHYLGEQEVVEREHIDAICQRSVESRIFDLVECMGTSKRALALRLYHDMLTMREPANRVLFMITRQFRLNYLSKLYQIEGYSMNDIAKSLKVQSFVVRKCLEQGRGFSVARLEEAMKDALQTEIDIRTGVYHPDFAVEQLIIKYSGMAT